MLVFTFEGVLQVHLGNHYPIMYHIVYCSYALPHDSGRVLWFYTGHPCVRPSVVCPSVRILFPDDNLSKHHLIFTKLGMCIGIVEIWFGIANGQILSNFDGVICLRLAHIFVSGR